MIPLRDDIPSKRTPFVNYALIGLNVLAFWYELGLGPNLRAFVQTFGLVPVRFHLAEDPLSRWVPVFASMFLHGGVLHLVGNMLYLYIFGDNVEDRLGHGRYLLFYLLAGTVAGLVQAYMFPSSQIPMVGASGAVAGVTGAYLLFYPHARVLTVVPVFFFLHLLYVPAAVFLVFWFILQFAYGTASLGMQGADVGGVAWWAHVGGFLFGIGAALILAEQPARGRAR